MPKTYIRPDINEGMFSSEYTVIINCYYTNDGGDIKTSGFIDKSHFKDGKLEVEVMSIEEDMVLLKIPGRMLEAPGDKGYLTVHKRDLITENYAA